MSKSTTMPEDLWRACLEGTARHMLVTRRTMGLIPSNPRCKFCSIPFRGPGGFVLRHLSERYGPWDKNPNLCRRCVIGLGSAQIMGAEVHASFLFADVRRSSDLARSLGTMEFTQLMQRFYAVATEVLFEHEALLDKFVGDEVVGFFLPFMVGDHHPTAAVDAARALFEVAGYGSEDGPWIPLGAAVHTGTAFVGYISRGEASEFTAMGDTINVAAHLAGQAGPGEILVTEQVGAALETGGLERRHLSLKGHELDALVIGVAERSRAPGQDPAAAPP
jgi:adenylate cyclase